MALAASRTMPASPVDGPARSCAGQQANIRGEGSPLHLVKVWPIGDPTACRRRARWCPPAAGLVQPASRRRPAAECSGHGRDGSGSAASWPGTRPLMRQRGLANRRGSRQLSRPPPPSRRPSLRASGRGSACPVGPCSPVRRQVRPSAPSLGGGGPSGSPGISSPSSPLSSSGGGTSSAGTPSVQSAPAGTAHRLRMRRGPPPVVSPLASHRRPRLCRSSLPTPRWLRSLLLPRRLPLRRQSPTRLRHRPALPPAHLSGTPPLRHPRSALPQAPALRLLRPCHSDRRPHLHPQHLLRLPARRPRRPHRSDPASPPPPRPVQQALWERLRQYRFRPHAPSATQLPPPRPPVHCAGSPPAAVIRCSWPVASVPPSTPSPTWTSASSG